MGSDKLRLAFSSMPLPQKRLLALAVIAGGLAVGGRVQKLVRDAQKEQARLCSDIQAPSRGKSQNKIAVNKQFLNRLMRILSM